MSPGAVQEETWPGDAMAEDPTTNGESETNSVATETKPPTCGVCETNPPKYKCPRCFMPYCSVACNKTHRENHPPDPEPAEQKPLPPQTAVPTAEPSKPSDSDPNNPFHVLEHSDKLKLLFAKYPGLPQQLGRIHEATLPPKPAPGTKPGIPESLMQGAPKKDNWNHDMGIKNGKAALRRAKSARGEEGEGVREYYELVMHVMNEASNRDVASQFVQQQVAQEDNKLIERLLAQEKR